MRFSGYFGEEGISLLVGICFIIKISTLNMQTIFRKMKIIKNSIYFIVKLHSHFYCLFYKLLKPSYKTVAILVSKYPGLYGILLRRFFYQKTLQKCGEKLSVFYGAYIVYPEVEIGDNCTIEEYSIISLCTIGDDVIIAARVSIMSGSHHHDIFDVKNVFRKSKAFTKRVNVKNNVWIGTHAVIMEDVNSDTAVGAGAIVTKEFQSHLVIAGVPAKPVRSRLLNT